MHICLHQGIGMGNQLRLNACMPALGGQDLDLGVCLASPLPCLGDTAMGKGTWTCVCAWPRPFLLGGHRHGGGDLYLVCAWHRPFCAWGTPPWGRGLGLVYVLDLAPSVLGGHRHGGGDLDLGMCLASPLLCLGGTAMREGTWTCAWHRPLCAWNGNGMGNQLGTYTWVCAWPRPFCA